VFALHVFKVSLSRISCAQETESLLADTSLFHGRDWCSTGFPECLHCRQLHQGSHQKRPIHHYLSAVCASTPVDLCKITNESHRNDMFELSHRLIGIYKTANATQSLYSHYNPQVPRWSTFAGISIDNHPLAWSSVLDVYYVLVMILRVLS